MDCMTSKLIMLEYMDTDKWELLIVAYEYMIMDTLY